MYLISASLSLSISVPGAVCILIYYYLAALPSTAAWTTKRNTKTINQKTAAFNICFPLLRCAVFCLLFSLCFFSLSTPLSTSFYRFLSFLAAKGLAWKRPRTGNERKWREGKDDGRVFGKENGKQRTGNKNQPLLDGLRLLILFPFVFLFFSYGLILWKGHENRSPSNILIPLLGSSVFILSLPEPSGSQRCSVGPVRASVAVVFGS